MNSITQQVNSALLSWGIPVHYELVALAVNDKQEVQYTPAQVERALRYLVMKGVVRRVSPGVYSAFGTRRD